MPSIARRSRCRSVGAIADKMINVKGNYRKARAAAPGNGRSFVGLSTTRAQDVVRANVLCLMGAELTTTARRGQSALPSRSTGNMFIGENAPNDRWRESSFERISLGELVYFQAFDSLATALISWTARSVSFLSVSPSSSSVV